MPRYGYNLADYFHFKRKYMSKFSVLSVGLAMLDAFEKIHEAGYTYNDLKPDNVLMGLDPELDTDLTRNVFKNTKIHLIDYGFA
jgi:serine/threonine protein kinase